MSSELVAMLDGAEADSELGRGPASGEWPVSVTEGVPVHCFSAWDKAVCPTGVGGVMSVANMHDNGREL